MAAPNVVAKTWDLPPAWNDRFYSDPANVPSEPGEFTPWQTYDFEFGTAGDSAVGVDGFGDADGAPSTLIDTEHVYSGTRSAKCTVLNGGTKHGGVWKYPSSTNGGGIAAGDELWARMAVYIPSSYSITTGDGGMKFWRWRFYQDGVPLGSNTIQLWGAGPSPSGLRTEQEGSIPDTQTFTPTGGWTNRFVIFESYIKLGRTDGILRSWVDGILRGEVLNVDTMGTDTFANLWLMFLDFFNGGAPQTQAIWGDKVEVAWSGHAIPPNQDAAGNFYMGMS